MDYLKVYIANSRVTINLKKKQVKYAKEAKKMGSNKKLK